MKNQIRYFLVKKLALLCQTETKKVMINKVPALLLISAATLQLNVFFL